MRGCRLKELLALSLCILLLAAAAFAAKTSKKRKAAAGPALNKAYLQKVWDGWEKLDPAKQAQFYAKGPHMFFDVAPLKYSSWSDYQAGVAKELADYKSATFTVNNDAEIHSCGADCTWAAATVKQDATMKSGRRDVATFRWTVIFQQQQGKWLIVHEHVSIAEP
jgi:ketosteroid isomerase-like protein